LDDVDALSIKTSSKTMFQTCKGRLKRNRLIAIISFLSGIIFLALFVGINITSRNKKEKDTHAIVLTIDKKNKSFTLDNYKINFADSILIIQKINPK
jgi:hypothetical protein